MIRTLKCSLVIAVTLTLTSMAWADRSVGYTASKLNRAPKIDGDLQDWPSIQSIDMYDKRQNDLRADVRVGWDSQNLYVAAKVTDRNQVNVNEPKAIHNADSFIFRVCTNADKQGVKHGKYDYALIVSPTSKSGKPACRFLNKAIGVDVINPTNEVTWKVTGEKDWTVEAAIPFKTIKFQPQDNAKLPFIIVVYDRDKADEDEWKQFHKRVQTFSKKKPANQRPYLVLGDKLQEKKKAAASKPKPEPEAGKTGIAISHHTPCNLFWPAESVSFEGSIKAPVSGTGKITVTVRDYFKKPVFTKSISGSYNKGQSVALPLDFGQLSKGYYETHVSWDINGTTGSKMANSFGVAKKINRTATETREKGYRIGLKMWYIGDIWWRKGAEWREAEAVDATCKLGLQWTRALMQQRAHFSTIDLVTRYPMNSIMKVESFPKRLFDVKRYGPMDEWIKNNDRAWAKKTVPMESGYKEYLKSILEPIPQNQKVFEVWNEAWDKMSAKDLAQISNWVSQVILKERPDAIIGPNLMGRTSKYGYDAEYIRAGGMKGMKMVALHPYAGSENRAWMRDYKKWLKEQTGRDIAIYITEYGSHSCPEGPSKRSEEEQARRTVRQTLALYAEDVAAMTPHWMGQREHNRTYHEHWFGHYRLNHQPKPVLMALANCAAVIDSSNYLGDLWFGPGVGAMVFEKNQKHTLALFTKKDSKSIVVEPGLTSVTITDMVGGKKTVAVQNGKLPLTVSQDIIYVSISYDVAKKASKKLIPERWPQPKKGAKNSRVAKKISSPKIDGKFDDWKGMTALEMVNPKVNGNDASGAAYLAWDSNYLYIGVNMRDNQVMNNQTPGLLYQDDSIELFISTEPRDKDPGYGPCDHQYFIAPTSKSGKAVVGEIVDREAHKLEPVKGMKSAVIKTKIGWAAELALPWSSLKIEGKNGRKLALDLRVNDSDKSHKRWKIDPTDIGYIKPGNPEKWSILELTD